MLSIGGIVATSLSGFRAIPGASTGMHIILALGTVLIALFSQSMIMFFFIGTGKEIRTKAKGVADEREVLGRIRAYRAAVFPAAMWAILAVMVTFILGGGVHRGSFPPWMHTVTAVISAYYLGRAYWIEAKAMNSNAELMDRFLREEIP